MNLWRVTFSGTLFLLFIMFYAGLSYGQGATGTKDTTIICGCPNIGYVNPGVSFFNGLDTRTHYSSLEDVTGWTYAGKKAAFDTLFYSGGYGGGSYSNYSTGEMSILSPRQPIRLVHPDKTFTVNFTPCRNISGIYELPITIWYKHPILDEMREFDYKSFDYSTLSFVKLLLELSRKRPDEIIRAALKEMARNDDNGVEMNRSIDIMNRDFKTGIPLVTAKDYDDTTRIDGILDSLVAKTVRQADVINAAFVQLQSGVHRPTYDEQYKLYLLFYRFYYNVIGFSKLEEMLVPSASADISNNKLKIEIASAILNQAGPKQQPAYIWGDYTTADYTTKDDLKIDFTSVCLPPTTIAGTNLGIGFTNALLISGQKQRDEQLGYDAFPHFAAIAPKTKAPVKPVNAAPQYDSLLTKFTGLLVKNVQFTMGENTGRFKLPGADVIINNKLIAGHIVLKISPSRLNEVIVNTPRGEKHIAISGLLIMLKKEKLGNISTKIVANQLYIYFKKLAI